jgi:hypothetical protein
VRRLVVFSVLMILGAGHITGCSGKKKPSGAPDTGAGRSQDTATGDAGQVSDTETVSSPDTGTGTARDGDTGTGTAALPMLVLRARVSGLEGSLVLSLGSDEILEVEEDGVFGFNTRFRDGDFYSIQVVEKPA